MRCGETAHHGPRRRAAQPCPDVAVRHEGAGLRGEAIVAEEAAGGERDAHDELAL